MSNLKTAQAIIISLNLLNFFERMSRAVLAPFEAYQKARVTFVQTVAELAQRPQNIEALQSAGKLKYTIFL